MSWSSAQTQPNPPQKAGDQCINAITSTVQGKKCHHVLYTAAINASQKISVIMSYTFNITTHHRYLDKRYHLLQTMKYKLYSDVNSDQAPITKSMAEKIAGSGLSHDDLKKLFVHHGKKGLTLCYQSRPPKNQE